MSVVYFCCLAGSRAGPSKHEGTFPESSSLAGVKGKQQSHGNVYTNTSLFKVAVDKCIYQRLGALCVRYFTTPQFKIYILIMSVYMAYLQVLYSISSTGLSSPCLSHDPSLNMF